jgi:hypothetical protein
MLKKISVSDKKLIFALHAIAWIIVVIIPLYLTKVFDNGNQQRLYQFYVHTVSAVFIFYVGYFWLIPQFFLRDRKILYVVILSGLILASYFLTTFIIENWLFDPVQDAKFQEAMRKVFGEVGAKRPPFKAFGFYYHILASILISGFALGLGLMEKLKENEKKQKELEQEKLNSELAFLKNQVSPHFFFNTLNNIYSLIGIDGPTAQDSVLKLSKLMRYLLYESEQGETMMSHEIDFMNNYIDLMKLRISQKVELEIDFPEGFSDFSVPPLLFVPFIENAFKHGISYREKSYIAIRMEIEGGQIHFFAENSLAKGTSTEEKQHSGIGLENIKKRLNLLYPAGHELLIDKTDEYFRVNLFIRKNEVLL